MNGYLAAALAVLICAAYPVATRAAVTGAFQPHELVTLRFGVGALLFLPFLLLQFRSIQRQTWRRGIVLTALQGAGMAALVIGGLKLAPATHAAALGPGAAPAWVVLLGFLVFGSKPSARAVAGATLCAVGVAALACWSACEMSLAVLLGDAMFLAASALGALYLLQLRRWGIGALQGAAIVSLFSALVVVPWYLWSASPALPRVGPAELLWQVLWQGVLIGCVALVALNQSLARLGAERSSAFMALVPVLSAVLGVAFLGEVPSAAEIAALAAISVGVSIAAVPRRPPAMRAGRPLAEPPRSARTVGYPARDSAP